ncbi:MULTISPECIES: hypothetical protein [Thioalkalivibrio]|uniref:Uncharacterized protein n=1 Tax=Thioalkalivibrio versutus TaxID=106634 RepID=A0A0G3GAF6_9GAMM|nr:MULTISPECIES: hypothetical protein [Thioalkalivibrio]AKJ95791.1 hypothetical protein TVD_10665 [Thioalkalivibrio versutus]
MQTHQLHCFAEDIPVDKSEFQVDGHYAVTLKDENGKLRPANIYVHDMQDNYMIARRTSGGDVGLLFKMDYDDVIKLVRTHKVLDRKKFMVPAAMLKPKLWETRDSMRTYSSAPGLGK